MNRKLKFTIIIIVLILFLYNFIAIIKNNTLNSTKISSIKDTTYELYLEKYFDEDGNLLHDFNQESYDVYKDNNLIMLHAAIYEGNGIYRFITESKYLKMPFFRNKDFIGSYANYFIITQYDTKNGWYTFEDVHNKNNITTYKCDLENFYDNLIYNLCGSSAELELPKNIYIPFYTKVYKNLKTHFEYTSHVQYFNKALNPNSTGIYDHTQIKLYYDNNTSLYCRGNDLAIIGKRIIGKTKRYKCPIMCTYRPEK